MDSRSISNIVIDAHRKRIGLLKYHAHSSPQLRHIDLRRIDITFIQIDTAIHSHTAYQIVHPVKCLQKSGFSASGRPDQSGYSIGIYLHSDVLKRMLITII